MPVISERDPYGVLFHTYWTGETGREIQARGADAVILGLYLATNRHANMIGLYELPLLYAAHDLPVLGDIERLRVALADLAAVNYAHYDEAAGVVWVAEMARYRCGLPNAAAPLPAHDKRRVHAARLYATIRPNAFVGRFFDRYGAQLGIPERREPPPSQAPPKAPVSPIGGASRGNGGVSASTTHPPQGVVEQAPPEGHGSPFQGPTGSGSGSGSGSVRTGEIDQRASSVRQETSPPTVADGSRSPLRGTPIIKPRNLTAAFEGARIDVPPGVHHKLLKLRGDTPEAERELFTWYARVNEEWAYGAHAKDETGADAFAFWTARYNERWPATPAKKEKPRPAWATPRS